jgi:hypothetical protein
MLWINCGLSEWPLKSEALAIIRMLKPAILFRDDSNFYRCILEKSFTFSFYNRWRICGEWSPIILMLLPSQRWEAVRRCARGSRCHFH